jgi:uncharacterized protein
VTSQPPGGLGRPQPYAGGGQGSYGPPGGQPGGQPGAQPGWGQSWGQPQQQPYGQPGYPPPPGPGGNPYGYQRQPSFGGPQSGVPYYGGAPQPPAPRRRNPLAMVLLGMIGLVVLALAGLVIANLVSGTSSVAYQNDNYRVPPPDKNPPPTPIPDTYGEAEDWLVDNALYGQSVPVPVRCNSQPINVADADDAQLEEHFNGLMECLVRVWQPPLTAAGFQIVRPTVTIYGKEISTKCGKSGVNAFYCLAVPIVANDKWAADVVMAHEFGHAIQGRTGLLISANALAQRSDSKSEANLLIRRIETQADCFSGQFVRSVSQSLGVQRADLDGILGTYEAVGDDTLTGDEDIDGNHGLAATRRYWGSIGLSNSAISACNTFRAPASQVR